MSVNVLKQEIKEGKVRNLYLFYGPEEYLLKYYLKTITGMVLKGGLVEINRVVLDGKVDPKVIMEACETIPVFSEKKIIVVKNSGFFKTAGKKTSDKKTDKKEKSKIHDEGFAVYLGCIPEHACLVFVEDEIDRRAKLTEVVEKNGLIVEFGYQRPADLVKWVINNFKAMGKEIHPKAASLLVDVCEPGMQEIKNEIDKIASYIGDRGMVGEDDIHTVCAKSVKSRIFDLTDAIAAKDTQKAMKILNDVVSLKEPLQKILYMIARQLGQIRDMKLLADEGIGMDKISSKMGLHPYVAGKIAKQAGAFTYAELNKAIEECLAMDEAIKTGKINERIAVELLIASFAK